MSLKFCAALQNSQLTEPALEPKTLPFQKHKALFIATMFFRRAYWDWLPSPPLVNRQLGFMGPSVLTSLKSLVHLSVFPGLLYAWCKVSVKNHLLNECKSFLHHPVCMFCLHRNNFLLREDQDNSHRYMFLCCLLCYSLLKSSPRAFLEKNVSN